MGVIKWLSDVLTVLTNICVKILENVMIVQLFESVRIAQTDTMKETAIQGVLHILLI